MIRRAHVQIAVAVGLLALAAGCGASAAGPAKVDTGAPVSRERVGLVEWSIETQHRPLLPGPVTLTVTNAGGTEHDLAVSGNSGHWETPDLRPGQSVSLRITTKPDEVLHLVCTMPGHAAAGMRTLLHVAPRPQAGGE